MVFENLTLTEHKNSNFSVLFHYIYIYSKGVIYKGRLSGIFISMKQIYKILKKAELIHENKLIIHI